MAKKLLLVRHASTGSEYTGRYLGLTDVESDPTALDALTGLIPRLRTLQPGRCLASPLIRTRQTADCLVQGLDPSLPVEIEPDLSEIHFGSWEGLSFDEIVARYPAEVELWATGSETFTFPNGERLGAFRERIVQISKKLRELPEDVVLVVTHGGVVRNMICHLLGLSFENYILFDVQPGTCTIIDLFDDGGILVGFNIGGE